MRFPRSTTVCTVTVECATPKKKKERASIQNGEDLSASFSV